MIANDAEQVEVRVLRNADHLNAGLQLRQIRALSGILSPQVLVTFAVLGLLPLTFRYLLRTLRGVFNRHSGG